MVKLKLLSTYHFENVFILKSVTVTNIGPSLRNRKVDIRKRHRVGVLLIKHTEKVILTKKYRGTYEGQKTKEK